MIFRTQLLGRLCVFFHSKAFQAEKETIGLLAAFVTDVNGRRKVTKVSRVTPQASAPHFFPFPSEQVVKILTQKRREISGQKSTDRPSGRC